MLQRREQGQGSRAERGGGLFHFERFKQGLAEHPERSAGDRHPGLSSGIGNKQGVLEPVGMDQLIL